jgi:hypothetical protein
LIDGAGAGEGEGADVASVLVDDDPLPPQATTPALRKAIATRRAWDVVLCVGGMFSFE